MPPLPSEIVSKILEYADYKTVITCRKVSDLRFLDQVHKPVLIGTDTISCAAASKI